MMNTTTSQSSLRDFLSGPTRSVLTEDTRSTGDGTSSDCDTSDGRLHAPRFETSTDMRSYRVRRRKKSTLGWNEEESKQDGK